MQEIDQIKRCSDLWLERGDFILIAGGATAFRIHSDVLGQKSKVFHDLLNLHDVPRPDAEDMMDGCPVVHVTDNPDDFQTFLGFIFDGFE